MTNPSRHRPPVRATVNVASTLASGDGDDDLSGCWGAWQRAPLPQVSRLTLARPPLATYVLGLIPGAVVAADSPADDPIFAPPVAPRVTLQFTRHLFTFFPQLQHGEVQVEARTVTEALAALEPLAPGIGFYLRDELGRVRIHVNIFINTERIRDRRTQSDPLQPGDTVWILQPTPCKQPDGTPDRLTVSGALS